MTRVKEKLFLTAADYYGEGKREKKLSPFIFEALGESAIDSETVLDKGEQMSLLGYQPINSEQLTTNFQLLTSNFHIDYLSVSQIEAFQICPLHYKLSYIVRIPTPPSASLSFGSTMHTVMKEFFIWTDYISEMQARILHQRRKRVNQFL